jgi:hypothetical protein
MYESIKMECVACSSVTKQVKKDIYECKDCGHIYVNYIGDGLSYHKNTHRRDKKSGIRGNNEINGGIFTQAFHDRRKVICDNRKKYIEQYAENSNTILDIGAGGGTFLNHVSNLFDTLHSTEISTICIDNLKKQGYYVYEGHFSDLSIDKKYDIVTCWHVLEHIKDVDPFIKNLSDVTGKYLFLEVPTKRGLRDNVQKDFDGHYHYFSKNSLKIKLEKYFELIKIEEPGIQKPSITVIARPRKQHD